MNGVRLVNGVKIEQGVNFKPYLGKIWMAQGAKNASASLSQPKGGHLPAKKKDFGLIIPKPKKEFNKWTTEVIGWYTENWNHGQYVGVFGGGASVPKGKCNCIVKINYVKPNQKFSKGYAENSRYSKWFKSGKINASNYNQASMCYIARDAATFENAFFEDVIGKDGVSLFRYNDELEFFDVKDVAEIFGGQQLFNMEISPEPNVKLDLFLFTKLVMEEMKKIVGRDINWFAGSHFNTDNPHVHVKFASVDGKELYIDGDRYIKSGKFREICREITTRMCQGKGLEEQRAEREEAVYSPYQNSLDLELFKLLDDNNNVSSYKLRKSKNYRAILARLRDREKQGYCKREKDENGRSYWHIHKIYSKDLNKKKIADVLGIKSYKGYILDENPDAVYEGEVIMCKRPNDDSNTVYMALKDTDGRKHLRKAFIKEQDKDFVKGEEFDLQRFKQMNLQRMERC